MCQNFHQELNANTFQMRVCVGEAVKEGLIKINVDGQ